MNKLRVALLIALALMLNGCIWNRAKVNDAIVMERSELIVCGTTHASELPQLLGVAPSSIIPLRDGRRIYTFAYGDSKTEGFSLILVTLTKTNSVFTALYVVTDEHGTVQSLHRSPELSPEWETWPFGA